MIICPSCKEEIEDDSHYCDQCGQALVYCRSCGRVGKGRRCIYCGGLMMDVDELKNQKDLPHKYLLLLSSYLHLFFHMLQMH